MNGSKILLKWHQEAPAGKSEEPLPPIDGEAQEEWAPEQRNRLVVQ